MKFRIVAVGKPPVGPLRDAIEEYERRAARYWPLDVFEVRAEPAKSRTPDEVRKFEGERLLERASGFLVTLDKSGKGMSSEAFAKWVGGRREGAEDTSFVIGGAFGLSDDLRRRSNLLLSLSPWTVQHEMARLLLAEQLYRAGTIHRGEPYHKGD